MPFHAKPIRLAVFLGAALFALSARSPRAETFCSQDFRIQGTLTLDGSGGAGSFNPPNQTTNDPQWPEPWAPNHSTGWTARSCTGVPSYLTVESYVPGTAIQVGPDVMKVQANDLCLAAFGGRYEVEARMQLGSGYKGVLIHLNPVPVYSEIAEDFYNFDAVHTDCVKYCPGACADQGLPECNTAASCGCNVAPDPPQCLTCDLGAVACADGGPGVVTEAPLDIKEDVAFMDVRFNFGPLPSEGGRGGSCTDDTENWTNPNSAQVFIEVWDDAMNRWVAERPKAGTQFEMGSPVGWENKDGCEQRDIPAWGDLCPQAGFPPTPPNPLPDDLLEPRIPIYFAVPAGRKCRMRGYAIFDGCQGATKLDLPDLLFDPATNYDDGPFHYHDFPSGFTKGQWIQFYQFINQSDPATSYYITKVCDIDCDDDVPPPERSLGHGGGCCGPEYADLHGTMDLADTRCRRTIHANYFSMTLAAQHDCFLEHGLNAYTDDAGPQPYDKLMKCMPLLPYDPSVNPDDNAPPFNDPTCATQPCVFWPPPPDGPLPGQPPCPNIGPAYGEWMFQLGTSGTPQANYAAHAGIYNGRWWATKDFFLRLQDGKNIAFYAPIEGLHGLLMDDAPSGCAADIPDDSVSEWDRDEDYPNFHDVLAYIDSWRADQDKPCWSAGLFSTNVNRSVLDGADADDRKAFTICPTTASSFTWLGNRLHEPNFIRVKDYPGPSGDDDVSSPPIYPTWVPDSTFCSEPTSVRGIVRILDGSIDPSGQAHEIGLDSLWTLRRTIYASHLSPVWWGYVPAFWNEYDACHTMNYTGSAAGDAATQPSVLTAQPDFNVGTAASHVTTRSYHESPYSTSNGVSPQAETSLQYFWPHAFDSTDPDRAHQCINEVPMDCKCGAGGDWPAYFGMPRLEDPRVHGIPTPGLLDDLRNNYGLALQGASERTWENTELDLHYDNIIPLTNNMIATATTRQLDLSFLNEEFVSGITGEEAPVSGTVSITDVTKPIQDHGDNIFQRATDFPSEFYTPANVDWPYIVKEQAPRMLSSTDPALDKLDSQVDPRIGLDQESPDRGLAWCDVTNDTDPNPALHGGELPAYANAAECPNTNGRTLVDRYTMHPSDCRVENFGACFGEVSFVFQTDINQTPEPDMLVVTGGGYFNAMQDSQTSWAYPSTRPDLVIDHDNDSSTPPVIDLNEDGVPDQYTVGFEFRRRNTLEWVQKGHSNRVTAFLPAGRYNFQGFVELFGLPQGNPIPLSDVIVACGGYVTNVPELSILGDGSCSMSGNAPINGELHAPDGCTLVGTTIDWVRQPGNLPGTFDVTLVPPNNQSLVGTYAGNVPLVPGCNTITVTAHFDGSCGPTTVTETMDVISDTSVPFVNCGLPAGAPIEISLPPDACSVPVTAHAFTYDGCSDGPCDAAPSWARLVSFTATLTNGTNPAETFDCPTTNQTCPAAANDPRCFLQCDATFLPRTCGSYTLTWAATDLAGHVGQCSKTVNVTDTTPPGVTWPQDATLECPATAVVEQPTVADNCPVTITCTQDVTCTAGCPPSPPDATCIDVAMGCGTVRRHWTVTPSCSGLPLVHDQVITIRDTTAPVLANVPTNAIAACHADGWPLAVPVTASDACDHAPSLDCTQQVNGGNAEACQHADLQCGSVVRTWRAVDACGNATTASQTVTVVDQGAPVLVNVPAGGTIPCHQDPWPFTPAVSATDDCDADPTLNCDQAVNGGTSTACAHVDLACGTIVRTWKAMDECGHVTTATRQWDVVDDTPPTIDCPATHHECPEYVIPGVNPANAPMAHDTCKGDFLTTWLSDRDLGGCPRTYERNWLADERCGHQVTCVERWILDNTPTVSASAFSTCLWPPNHKYVCFGDLDDRVVVTGCHARTVRFDCESSQCDDQQGNGCPDHPFPPYDGDRGDGNTSQDCVVSDTDGDGHDDQVCAREERAGNRPEGRYYHVGVTVTDDCGRQTTVPNFGTIWVPHDQSTHPDCIFQGRLP